MNNQEAFEFATLAVIKQGVPSVHAERGTCKYRGANDTKCWVGMLIPDDQYRPKLEGLQLSEVRQFTPALAEFGLRFLRVGQAAHDLACGDANGNFSKFVEHFKDHARNSASELGLDASFLDKA